MAMIPGERDHPANIVDIPEMAGMRMSVQLFRSKSNVDFIRTFNSRRFHICGGESQVHINIRTD